jgi:hypothetical protein
LMTFAVLIAMSGYVLGVLKGSREGALNVAHFGIGTIVIALALLQVVYGYLRPLKGSPKRKLFNLVHWWSGRSTIAIAAVNSFIGVGLASANSKWTVFVSLVVFGWIVLFVGFSLFLSERFPVSEETPTENFWAEGGESNHHIHAVRQTTDPM